MKLEGQIRNKLRRLIDTEKEIEKLELKKKKVVNFFQATEQKYKLGVISYYEYRKRLSFIDETLETFLKKIDKEIEKLKKEIQVLTEEIYALRREEQEKRKKKVRKSFRLASIFFLLFFIFFVLFFFRTEIAKLTGFIIAPQEKTYQDNLLLEFNASQEYEWHPENYGQLTGLKVSGKLTLIDQGSVKIYFQDKLILDSSKLETKSSQASRNLITGLAVEGEGSEITEETPSSPELVEHSSETPSEPEQSEPEVNEPTQEKPEEKVSEENLTEENITEEEEEPVESLPEEIITYEIDFSQVCIETCDLRDLNLTDKSYILRIEIQDAFLHLDSITYTILPIESKNRAPKLKKEIPDQEILVNSSFMLNLSEYFSDPDGDALIFYYKVLENENLTNITINEEIFFVSAYDVGYEKLIVSASDGNLSVEGNQFTIKVVNVTNNPPILLNPIPNITILKNSNINLDLAAYFKDPDNDFLTFSSTHPENISVIIKDSYVTLVPEKDFVGNKTLKFYASDGNFTVESNEIFISVVEINFTCLFDEPRKEDIKLPGKWFLKEKNSLELKDDEHSKKVKNTANLVQVECGNALLYNLSHVAETKDNIGISSVFDVEEGKYRISFYVRPELQIIGNKDNGFSIIIDILDSSNKEIETYPPLVWNNDEVWEADHTQKEKRKFSVSDSGLWKKITIELELPKNSTKALIGFRSEGIEDYFGYVLITNFSLEKIS
ncbi:MAG: Ig-like domain-containing protein [Candidatus Pacearchaeota archaeon]